MGIHYYPDPYYSIFRMGMIRFKVANLVS